MALLNLLFAAILAGAECAPFRLDGPGGAMEHVPMREQRLGICYSPTAADLIDAYLNSHDPTRTLHRTSPLALAIETSTRLERPVRKKSIRNVYPFEGGYTCDAVARARAHGTCDAATWEAKYGIDNRDATDALYAAFLAARPPSSVTCEDLRREHNRDLGDVVRAVVDPRPPLAYFKTAVEHVCPPALRDRPRIPPCQDHVVSSPQDFVAGLNRHFDALLDKAQPMEIGYCNSVFWQNDAPSAVVRNDGRRPSIKYDLCEGFDRDDPEDDGGHSSVIIGRRVVAGQCQVLIKNSHGTNCDGYEDAMECHEGKAWVRLDSLARNVTSYSFLGEAP